ncbi:MAG: hypothetical protein GY879_01065 [Planctomycetes bacterium]|nr:hypothetical protein [Planctomycetota bacterium]MCP4859822.1 hypothetical protein [Planctomycetota bacterium]
MAKSEHQGFRWQFPVIVLALAFVLGWFTEGDWGHQMLGFAAFMTFAIPAAVLTMIAVVLEKIFPSKKWARAYDFPYVIFVLLAGFILSCFIGVGVNEYRIYEAKAYVEKVRQPMEAFYQEHGAYPERLQDLDGPRIPKRLREQFAYYSYGVKTYTFNIDDPTDFWAGWEYDSDKHEWSYWVD